MLDPRSNFLPVTQVPRVAVHTDDIPPTPAEQLVVEEVPANIEIELAPEAETVGFSLSYQELQQLERDLVASRFISFGNELYPVERIKKITFFPENNIS